MGLRRRRQLPGQGGHRHAIRTCDPDDDVRVFEIAIANGKVEGDKIAYSVSVDFGGMPLEMIWKGVVAAGEIKLDMEVFGMPFSLVVKKAIN